MKFLDGLNPNAKRILGISLASISGVLYAFTFTPALYVQDNYENGKFFLTLKTFKVYLGFSDFISESKCTRLCFFPIFWNFHKLNYLFCNLLYC